MAIKNTLHPANAKMSAMKTWRTDIRFQVLIQKLGLMVAVPLMIEEGGDRRRGSLGLAGPPMWPIGKLLVQWQILFSKY